MAIRNLIFLKQKVASRFQKYDPPDYGKSVPSGFCGELRKLVFRISNSWYRDRAPRRLELVQGISKMCLKKEQLAMAFKISLFSFKIIIDI